ncbi:hypothetical protein T492DRAFT_1028505 [Pavlovales sp. CCMP2436]|nr:hypothetical protein T492DRAFT_1028505 [Pavlovales sp. CCMP2436]
MQPPVRPAGFKPKPLALTVNLEPWTGAHRYRVQWMSVADGPHFPEPTHLDNVITERTRVTKKSGLRAHDQLLLRVQPLDADEQPLAAFSEPSAACYVEPSVACYAEPQLPPPPPAPDSMKLREMRAECTALGVSAAALGAVLERSELEELLLSVRAAPQRRSPPPPSAAGPGTARSRAAPKPAVIEIDLT